MDDLKSYIIGRLLWDPDTDIDDEMNRFFNAVYGENAAPYLVRYVALMEQAVFDHKLTIYQFPDEEWLTDELVKKADAQFRQAMNAASTAVYRRRIEREYLAVRFLQLARMEMGTPNRTVQIQQFFEDVKRFGITAVMKRNSLAFSKQCMMDSRYALDRSQKYKLYYIMQ